MRALGLFFTFSAACLLSACVSISSGARAPEPTKRVDPARFYSGTWLEIARRPMWITNGCVAGSTEYRRMERGKVAVRDACRQGAPSGRERSIEGDGTILDPVTNAKLRVRYNALATREYWIIDHAEDYRWFIEASPDFRDLYIFARSVPSRAQLSHLVRRAQALGYDVRQLEFPQQPPR